MLLLYRLAIERLMEVKNRAETFHLPRKSRKCEFFAFRKVKLLTHERNIDKMMYMDVLELIV